MFRNKKIYEEIIDKILTGELEGLENYNVNNKIVKKLLELKEQLSISTQDVKGIMYLVLELAVDISTFDVRLEHESKEIINVTEEMEEVSNRLYTVYQEITASIEEVARTHSNLLIR